MIGLAGPQVCQCLICDPWADTQLQQPLVIKKDNFQAMSCTGTGAERALCCQC